MICHDCTADLVGQLNGNGQKGMLQLDAPPVENFWLRHCPNRNLILNPSHSQNSNGGAVSEEGKCTGHTLSLSWTATFAQAPK